jgi:hypothetical protein
LFCLKMPLLHEPKNQNLTIYTPVFRSLQGSFTYIVICLSKQKVKLFKA